MYLILNLIYQNDYFQKDYLMDFAFEIFYQKRLIEYHQMQYHLIKKFDDPKKNNEKNKIIIHKLLQYFIIFCVNNYNIEFILPNS